MPPRSGLCLVDLLGRGISAVVMMRSARIGCGERQIYELEVEFAQFFRRVQERLFPVDRADKSFVLVLFQSMFPFLFTKLRLTGIQRPEELKYVCTLNHAH